MNIVDAPYQLRYEDPAEYIRRKILPVTRTCKDCETVVLIDFDSDLYAVQVQNAEWVLAFKCMVCKTQQLMPEVSAEGQKQQKEYALYENMTDEEYAESRLYKIMKRTEAENTYNTRRSVDMYRHSGYIDWDKYLPSVPPAEKPKADKLIAEYDKVLPYYIELAQQNKKVSLNKPDVKLTGGHWFGLGVLAYIAAVVVLGIYVNPTFMWGLAFTPVAIFTIGHVTLEE